MATRARKLTNEEASQVEALAAYLTVSQMAEFFGLSERTMFRIIDRDKDVEASYRRGKAKAIAAVAQSLLQQARSGNMTAAIFYLKTQAGWKPTPDEVRVSHIDAGSTSAAEIESELKSGKLTPEEMVIRYQELTKGG